VAVDSSRFPIAKTIAGVVLDLDPGALRTLHWHPNATSGSTSSTARSRRDAVRLARRYRSSSWQQGDVGYIRRATGTRSKIPETRPRAS